uniref:Kelch repeat-containing F-box family protein n=1 Tax=Solanum tuberosum TaxID=4113 RepID=M0ZSU3_SOLTU
MLEDRSCLVPRDFTRESNNWSACMNYSLDMIEVQHGKRPLENNQEDEVVQRKLPKLSDARDGEEVVLASPDDQAGHIEVNSWVPSEGPPQWNLLGRKRSGSFVYNCAVMGC